MIVFISGNGCVSTSEIQSFVLTPIFVLVSVAVAVVAVLPEMSLEPGEVNTAGVELSSNHIAQSGSSFTLLVIFKSIQAVFIVAPAAIVTPVHR
jgi:hypothetical protein